MRKRFTYHALRITFSLGVSRYLVGLFSDIPLKWRINGRCPANIRGY